MKKLTPKTALQITLKTWDALAKSGNDQKPENGCEHFCGCCEYVCQQIPDERKYGMACSDGVKMDVLQLCPLKSLWPNGCTGYPSPYNDWQLSCSDEKRKAKARIIANACRAKLKKLGV